MQCILRILILFIFLIVKIVPIHFFSWFCKRLSWKVWKKIMKHPTPERKTFSFSVVLVCNFSRGWQTWNKCCCANEFCCCVLLLSNCLMLCSINFRSWNLNLRVTSHSTLPCFSCNLENWRDLLNFVFIAHSNNYCQQFNGFICLLCI